jgi:serine phosphatase RsbU (regulator of sigma subunit)
MLIAVPVFVKADLLGVLLVEEGSAARRFRARRLEIIKGIAQQIAMAIQNDLLQGQMVLRERLETEGQLARQIQRTFIPEALPVRHGWEFAARWEMARQVGGDFYDFVDLSDGRLGLMVADVSDKGMPAALFMALTRTLFRATASDIDSPAEVLRRINSLLLPDTSQGMFVTAVYAVLDPARRELTYANAGHNPPLWLRSDAPVEKLSRTGMALGVMDSPSVSQRTIQLRPSETILVYTDGLTEAFSPDGELFGEPRLIEAVNGSTQSSAADLVASLQSQLMSHVGSLGLADDLTMLALKHM